MAKPSVILSADRSAASSVAVGVLCLLGVVQLATLAHTGWQSWRGLRPVAAAPAGTPPAAPWTAPQSTVPATGTSAFDAGSLPPLPSLGGISAPHPATPDSLPPLPKLPGEASPNNPPPPTRAALPAPRPASNVMALPTAAPAAPKPAPAPRPGTGNAQVDELIEVAMLSREANDNEGALKALERADLILPDNAAVLRQKALTYSKMGQMDKSNALLERAGRLGPASTTLAAPPTSAPVPDALSGAFGSKTAAGPLSFGQSSVARDPTDRTGEKVIVKLPVKSAPGATINPNDMNLDVFFFDKVDGTRVEPTKSDPPVYAFDPPVDFKAGEEMVTVIYHMPKLSDKEVAEFGQRTFHGYAVKLYYQGRLMDSTAAPRDLLNHNDGGAQATNPLLPAPSP